MGKAKEGEVIKASRGEREGHVITILILVKAVHLKYY